MSWLFEASREAGFTVFLFDLVLDIFQIVLVHVGEQVIMWVLGFTLGGVDVLGFRFVA